MLNKLASCSSRIILSDKENPAKGLSPWKKLQQTHEKGFLTPKEFREIKLFTHEFFAEEFIFEPMSIIEVNL